ncbi:MAG: recombinase family protein [Nitrospirae bacterium]|nr:recombinase family protein [Nitrospirota bacterium]MBF0344571.1 recombinase family protein [Nitrospirota bacterium]
MKTAGYVRVSRNEQTNEGISLENQAQKIRQYCQLNELELTSIITDAGLSGKTTNRPGLTELLHLLKTKKVQAVVVYKLDRLSQKVLDTLTIIEMFDKVNVAFHSTTEKIDTSSAMGHFLLNVTASLAQMERDLISERTADALQMKIKKHERAGQIPDDSRGRERADSKSS